MSSMTFWSALIQSGLLERKIWPPTSTAVLLKVRHAGSGLIYGNANGPLERGS